MVTDTARQEATGSVEFDFDAGWLCLDFANTVPVHPGSDADGPRPDEHRGLDSYADFIEWSRQAGQLDHPTAERLLRNASADPAAASGALARAIELREIIYRLVVAAISGGPVASPDMGRLDAALTDARARLHLAHLGNEFVWTWKDLDRALDAPLGPVLESAAQLLTSRADLARVRRCGGERCDWLFMDTSKNGSRRWCSMSSCGNRAKAKRHYQKQRAAV